MLRGKECSRIKSLKDLWLSRNFHVISRKWVISKQCQIDIREYYC